MKLTRRRHRFTRTDWTGYALLMIAGGAVGLVALFLPWANEYTDQFVNFSLAKPPEVAGVMQTKWGAPVLVAALATLAAAVLLLLLGPRRVSIAPSLVVVAAGAVYAMESVAAADSMIDLYRPGLGLYLTLLTGILLVPIGLASIAVGEAMRRHTAACRAATSAPPAPGSAQRS
jgi:hypothetical protein